MHGIYKYVYKNEVVYIGKTDSSFRDRIAAHRLEEKFKPYLNSNIYIFETSSKSETDLLETSLINKYKPILNVQKVMVYKIDVDESDIGWNLYSDKIRKYKNFKSKNQHQNIMQSHSLYSSYDILSYMLYKWMREKNINSISYTELALKMIWKMSIGSYPSFDINKLKLGHIEYKIENSEICDNLIKRVVKRGSEYEFQINLDAVLNEKYILKNYSVSNTNELCNKLYQIGRIGKYVR